MDDPENDGAPAPDKGASQPPNREKPTSSWAIPIITAAIVIAAFCVYYFVYVSARREYLANRNFRALATLGDQLQTIVSIHGSILEYYADQTDPQRMKVHDRGKKPLREFLLVRPEDENLKPAERDMEALRDYLKFYASGFDLPEAPSMPSKRASRLEVLRRNGLWYMVFTATYHKAGELEFTASRPLGELMQPLVDSLPFDDILLVSQKGGIVYQKAKAGPQFTNLGDLLQTGAIVSRDKPAGQPVAGPEKQPAAGEPDSILRNADPVWRNNPVQVSDIALTGTKYKLFIQPVLLNSFIDDPDDHEPPQEFVLCGLRSSKSLEWEALSISYTVIIWVTALFFVVCLSGPLLKIAFMNHRERLRRREIVLIALSLVLLAGVFTLCGLQALPGAANDDTEEQLQALGKRFQAKIVTELGNMRAQMVQWCRSPQLQQDLQSAANDPAAQEREIIRDVPGDSRPLKTIAKTPPPGKFLSPEGGYPYLNNAFWTDDDGHQIVKWSIGLYVTPMIDVSQLSSYTDPRTTYLNDQDPPFHFGPVLPPNKYEYLAALTINTCDCNPKLCATKTIRGDIAQGSAFLVARPLTLIDPILPYGYGFALVDRTGLVLFHSDKTRNNSENFRQETDWSNELYAAMFAQASQRSVPLNYKGRDYLARVFSIPAPSEAPRSLIIYRDLTSVRTRNLEAVTVAATLYLLILALPIAVVAIWWAVHRPPFVPAWLWPNRRHLGAYLYQIAAYILLLLLFCLAAFGGSVEQIMVACFVVPYTALSLTSWYFRLCTRRAEAGVGASDMRRSKAALAVLTVLGGIVFLYALALTWPHPREPALMLGFGLMAAAPVLKKPRLHLLRRLETWFSERASQQNAAHLSPLRNYKAAFVAAAVLLLFLIGVLTPMALFQAAQRVERRLGIKQAQLHLASSLAERRRTMLEECEESDKADGACADFKDSQGMAWQFILPNLPSGSLKVEPHPTGNQTEKCKELYSGWLRSVIYLLRHNYNDVSAETRGIIADCSAANSGGDSPEWSWDEKQSGVRLRWHGVRPAEEGPPEDLVVSSAVPNSSRSDLFTGAEVAAAVVLLMGGLCWGLARKLFLFDVAPLRMTGARQAAESLREGRSLLVIVPTRFADWQAAGTKCSLSAREAAKAGPRWGETLDLDAIPKGTVVEIRHFEYGEDEAETENQKFILIERLIGREGTQIVAIMTASPSSIDYRRRFPSLEVVDLREEPFYWLEQYDCPARDLIWKECRPLAALWPIGAQLAEDLRKDSSQADEMIEPDTVASEVLERAERYYRLIWKECSMDEKFVLAQLAEDGMLNPTNRRAIRQLMRRGLIIEDPQFRPMNESFRRFVRSVTTAELKTRWITESRQSGWGKTHGVFFTTMAALGLFLLATQNALWQSSAAYVTTALGALGTLAKLFNTFRGGGGASAEKPS